MKYKIYSDLVIPPTSAITNLKGNNSVVIEDIHDLIDFIKQKAEEVDFLDIIETHKDYVEEYDDFDPSHFSIDCLEAGSRDANFTGGEFAVYDLEKDPEEKNMSFLYFSIDVLGYEDSYFVFIKPFLDINGPIGKEQYRGEKIDYILTRYFYINSITKQIKKLTPAEQIEKERKFWVDRYGIPPQNFIA